MKKIAASELPEQNDGAIYHLNLHPEELADNVLLVGDPGRVAIISNLFDSVELKKQNRELVTHTGTYRNKRVTVLSTGMGTDNIDIVLNELDALANIDLHTREIKSQHRSLNLIRIGTSGSLQTGIDVGSFVAASQGLGMDGLLQFYRYGQASDENLVKAFVSHTGWNKRLPYPYCTPANEMLLHKIGKDMCRGITISAPGFFGPQGRQVRAPLQYPELIDKIGTFSYNGQRISNMEMECSAIYGLGNILGHRVLTVCLIIANRITGKFLETYTDKMLELCTHVLDNLP